MAPNINTWPYCPFSQLRTHAYRKSFNQKGLQTYGKVLSPLIDILRPNRLLMAFDAVETNRQTLLLHPRDFAGGCPLPSSRQPRVCGVVGALGSARLAVRGRPRARGDVPDRGADSGTFGTTSRAWLLRSPVAWLPCQSQAVHPDCSCLF